MNTNGNTILITGGTSGIGYELLRQFYQRGNKIITTSRAADKLAMLPFPGIHTIVCDLASPLMVRQLIETCLDQYPDINMIINNAGIQEHYNWLEEKEGYARIEEEIRVNLNSPLQIIYGLLPLLVPKPSAAIVNVSSGLALTPKRSAPLYCGTKAAIHIFTKALRYQLENSHIGVFEILPSMVETPMTTGRGKGKITPEQLVNEFMINFSKNKWESYIGKTKVLKFLLRVYPRLAERLLKNG